MDICGADSGQIKDGYLSGDQRDLIATFDNQCTEPSGHGGDHVFHRPDGKVLSWDDGEDRFGIY